jgi:hypothetical protein
VKPSGKPLAKWLRSIRPTESSVLRLAAETIGEELQVITEWTPADVQIIEGWAEDVAELAHNDAESRGTSTRYQVQHVRDDRVVHSHPLRVRVDAEKDESAQFDGTTASLLQQQQRHLERMAGLVSSMAQKAQESQASSLALLGKSYVMLDVATRRNAELEAENAKLRHKSKVAEKEEPDHFAQLIEMVMAHKLGAPGGKSGIAKQLLGELGLPEDTDPKKIGALLRMAVTEDDGTDGGSH